MAEKKKFNPVDLAGIGNLLEYLVAADNITCEERDRIMLELQRQTILLDIWFLVSPVMARAKMKY